jgi:O-antigen/teichoic acid export membrane protein
MISLRGSGSFLRLLGSSIVSQAILSAASLLVGLILIRRQTEVQYGYYVLVTVTLMLLTGLQLAFVQPALVVRLAQFERDARRDLVGGLLREQRRLVLLGGAAAGALTAALWLVGALQKPVALLVLAGVFAAMATLYREFFRMVLLCLRRPIEVLMCDATYVVLLVGGAFLATFSPYPAPTAALTLGIAAAAGGSLLGRALWRHEPWLIGGASVVREIAPMGAWSMSGSAVHWAFSQGYTYLVAALLDVRVVAALAATRLLLMPVNLLSTGIGQMMLPTASRWLHLYGARQLYRRLLLFCLGLALVVLCYDGVMWLLRDWIFTHVLKKEFDERDALLLYWAAIFMVMMFRDQLMHLLVVRGRMRQLSTLTLCSAALALTISYLAIPRLGAVGALIGVLVGEVTNVGGIASLTWIERNRPVPPAAEPKAP